MSNKPKIKPVHLALVGLTIIVLGILIPSFFISAFSTIGFAIIIGSIILLSAYVFFAFNLVRSKGKKTIKWLALPIILVMLVVGGFFANGKYNQYLANKIYTINDNIKTNDLDFKIIDVSKNTLPFNAQDADLNTLNCDIINYGYKWVSFSKGGSYDSSNPHEFVIPSDCSHYNEVRDKARKYIADYDSRMTITYQVDAKNTVVGKDLHIEVIPDSGREIVLNTNSDNSRYSFMKDIGKKDYIANPTSDFGGNLNKGLSRKGTVGFDLQKTEKVVDIIVKYHDDNRTIRINR